MKSICGADCSKCDFKGGCKGCRETCGSPFGGKCLAAEYIKFGGMAAFDKFKEQIISEFNSLAVEGLPEIDELHCLWGAYVNLEYKLPNGQSVKFLDDKNIYIGTQVKSVFDDETENGRCFGLVAGTDFLLVSEHGAEGDAPEIVVYKRR